MARPSTILNCATEVCEMVKDFSGLTTHINRLCFIIWYASIYLVLAFGPGDLEYQDLEGLNK